MTPARLRQLLALAKSRKARDLARLEALAVAERALEREARELSVVHTRDMAEGPGAAPLALLGHRIAWAEARRAAIRARRAALAVEIAEARAAAVVSLGKHRALEHLLDGADRAAAVALEARAERDAPPRG